MNCARRWRCCAPGSNPLPEQKGLGALKADIDVMSHVVSQLLEIAELENAGLRIDDRVDLYAVAADVVSMIAGVAIAQGKEVALTGGPVLVRGNEAMIFRAIRNLADNAIKHTESGSEVIVDVREDGTVRVLDKGPGVPPAERALIVRRFWRARRDQDGAGLGLSIVSRIAELHGAKLGISDRDGGGAVFSLSFRDRLALLHGRFGCHSRACGDPARFALDARLTAAMDRRVF